MDKEVICLRGDRDLWIDFTAQVRKDRKEVWDVVEPMIREYLKRKH